MTEYDLRAKALHLAIMALSSKTTDEWKNSGALARYALEIAPLYERYIAGPKPASTRA